MNDEDKKLIDDILEGGIRKRRACNQLLKDHIRYIYSLLIGKLNLTEDDAYTVYHDSWVKVLESIEARTFRGNSKLSTYFYTTLYRTGLNFSNRIKREPQKESTDILVHLEDERVSPSKSLEVSDQIKALEPMMNSLGNNCKDILLKWADGYNMKEIAQILGLANAKVVKARKSQCLKKLKKLLGL